MVTGRWIRFACTVLIFSSLVSISKANDADEIAAGLQNFANRLDDLASFGVLDDALPLTGLSPAAEEGLHLADLFSSTLGANLTGPFTDLAALAQAIQNASDTDFLGLGLSIAFENVSVVTDASDSSLINVSFDVSVLRNVSFPISFIDENNPIKFNGGGLPLDLALDTTFQLQFDKNQTDPDLSFYLTTPPSLSISIVNASVDLSGFNDLVGFADVSVSGTLALDLDIGIDFLDPDDDGRITLQEWSNTSLADLVDMGFREEAGDEIAITLNLDSSLIGTPASVDGTITLIDDDVTNGINAPTVSLGLLDDFTNLKPTQILSGLATLASTVGAAELITDVQLPFMQQSIGSTIEFAQPLLDFIRQQSTASIVCGTIADDPPRGDFANLSIGDEFFCQATGLDIPFEIRWINTSSVMVVSNGTDLDTAGINPTDYVTMMMTEEGRPDIRFEFKSASGADFTSVSRLFLSAEELLKKLSDLAGFDGNIDNLTYHASSKTLTYRLQSIIDPPAFVSGDFDFADRLQSTTNLCGLSSTAGASVSIDPQDVSMDLTFGMILVQDVDDITPDDNPSSALDRFFIQVSGADHHILKTNVNITATVDLKGKIGFVEVGLTGDGSANAANPGTAFEIVAKDASQPMLSVDIQTPAGGIEVAGVTTITNAILINQLLSDITSYVSGNVNIKMNAGLKVTAELGDPLLSAEGSIAIDWPDISTGSPAITADTDFDQKLKLFDTDPSVFGQHDGAASATNMTDSTHDFTTIPGAAGRTLRNLTDGSRCVVTDIIGTNTLECTLSGGLDNDWGVDDEYELEGNPLDLLSVILDNFDLIVEGIDGLTGGTVGDALNTKLPIVGVSPEDLLSYLDDLEEAIEQIRGGDRVALILCELSDTVYNGVTLTSEELGTLVGLPANTNINCKAVAISGASSDVTWSVIDLTQDPHVSVDITAPADTVSASPSTAMLNVATGGTLGKEFQIRVTFASSDTGDHTADLPEETFSLQSLERLLENKLSLPDTAFLLEVTDLPLPGSDVGDGVQDLVFRLGFGECTRGNTHLTCLPSDRSVPPLELRMNLGLDNLSELDGLVGLNAEDPGFTLEYAARAQLDLVIPLALNFNSDSVVIASTSGVTIQIATDATLGGIEVTAGPLTASISGVAKLGVQFELQETGTDDTYTIPDYIDSMTASIGGSQTFNCGDLVKPLIIEGTHSGAGPTDAAVTDAGKFSAEQVGAKLRNLTSDQECTITHADSDTVKCLDGAGDPIVTWNAGDKYEVVDNDSGSTTALIGDACSLLSMTIDGDAVGQIGFKATDIEDPDDMNTEEKWYAHASLDSKGLLDRLLASALDFKLLLKAFKFLVGEVQDLLEGGASKLNLPFVGNHLDGGAGVCSALGRSGNGAGGGSGLLGALDDLETLLDSVPDPKGLHDTIQNELYDALMDSGLLLDINGADGVTKDDIEIKVLGCGGPAVECGESDSLLDVEDIRVTFLMGQGIAGATPGCSDPDPEVCPPGVELPFDLGIPGIPLGIEGSLVAKAGWSLLVDFGLSRSEGPYLAASGPRHLVGDAELKVGASIGLGGGAPCDPDLGIVKLDEGYNGGTNACLEGHLAFMKVTLQNGDGSTGSGADDPQPTEMQLLTKLDITSTAGEKIGFTALVGGKAALDLSITANATADLRFRASTTGTKAKLPSILGTFSMNWDIAEAGLNTSDGSRLSFNSSPDKLDFGNIHMDVGEFFSGFVKPMVKDVGKAVKPFKPVIDMVRAPVPLVDDLSRMTGGPKITLLTLMEIANGGKRLKMIENLIALAEFINEVDTLSPKQVIIPLGAGDEGGSFSVDATEAVKSKKTPDKASRQIKNSKGKKGLMKSVTDSPTKVVSFPFMEDSGQIFGMLLGQDVTLMRFDAGEMRATATVGPFTYCCIPVGPVPVGVFIEGSATLIGRFAMGYDTVGLRQSFGGGSVVDVLDGIFIDDLDSEGRDVPELSLIGEVRAGAGVDIGFAAAGVEGGVRMTVDLNLDDQPEPDGKLRLYEIAGKISNPICLFDVRGKLEAFLGAWVRVGFEWFSKSWRFEILRITLLEFSAACEPPAPQPAVVDGINLVINMGSLDRRRARRFNVDEVDEEVIVRQLNTAGTRFSVSMMGFIEEYGGVTGVVRIDGDSGADVISLKSGTIRVKNASDCLPPAEILGVCDATNDPCTSDIDCTRIGDFCNLPTENVECLIPFTRKAIIHGGAGDDLISAGGGNDELFGDEGNDKISGGDGNDTIHGGTEDDVLAGDAGNDVIYGNSGNDTITGGPDNALALGLVGDVINGGPGDDDINGGPGTNDESGPGVSPDGNDRIIGGSGNDIIQGFYGDDVIFGDEVLLCDDMGATSGGFDKIDGGFGNDRLFGGNNDDVIGGEQGDDLICGNGGNDLLDGDDTDANTADGRDELHGGPGDDQIFGRGKHDVLFGDAGNDALYGNEGPDDLIGGSGRDVLVGGEGVDIILGDGGSIAPHDHEHTDSDILDHITRNDGEAIGDRVANCNVTLDHLDQPTLGGVGNSDCIFGSDGSDYLFGEAGHDRMFGDGEEGQCHDVVGCLHNDYMEGNSGNDMMRGGLDADIMFGNSGDDEMFGDSGNDRMFGCDHASMDCNNLSDRDMMRGGKGDDYMEGNADQDRMFGDAGQDDMVGGSTRLGMSDGADEMFGNAGADVMVGDNGTIVRGVGFDPADGTAIRVVTRFDLNCAGAVGGSDVMHGNQGNDDMYGGCFADTIHGDQGDDYVEGNQDGDLIFGDLGQDDLMGGSGRSVSDDDATAVDGRLDGNDEIHGGSGVDDLVGDYDVIIGDNGTIDRMVDEGGHWIVNSFNGAISRRIRFLDVEVVGGSSILADASGDDRLYGEANDDLLYGQGGNDFISGGTGEDYLEGNAGDDVMEGNAGDDDMIGGTGRINDDPVSGTVGRYDGADVMRGGDGFDVMAGDNAILVRTLFEGLWQQNTYNDSVVHDARILLDIDSSDVAIVSGDDVMFGGGSDDLMYGQGGDDEMHGDDGDDFMEGNAGFDTMTGNADNDDMIGGTVVALLGDVGDHMEGNDGHDVLLGDNGKIERPLDESGLWVIDINGRGIVRSITLHDIEFVGGVLVDPASHGSDVMYGGAGMDQMFGQGNTRIDDDGDGRFNEDPIDGVDNDRDGREGVDSSVYDCEDGVDNDGDGLVDAEDPDCASKIDEDAGGDEMHGGAGMDYMEGNEGSDWLTGDDAEDDIIGGSSSGNGVIGSGVPPTNLLDGDDVIFGGLDDDVIVGDNAVIRRRENTNGFWVRLRGYGYNLGVRDVVMDVTPESVGAFGHDYIRGDAGHDDLYGQLGDDFVQGNDGEDAIVGDLGVIVNELADGTRSRLIQIRAPFLEDTIFEEGSLHRLVELFSFVDGEGAEGHDLILGGDGRDSIHAGPGNDMVNGDGDSVAGEDPIEATDDEDHLFGGDGDDVMWGGRGHDHLWGGHGNDHLDVKPRIASKLTVPDTPEWFIYGQPDNYQGLDIIYGGWDQDAMQASDAAPGPELTDRLIDWNGGYNVYYVCQGAYGEGTITRIESPGMREFLFDLATGDGAFDPYSESSSGFREIGYVFPNQARDNSHPVHPDFPGHFVCDDEDRVRFNRRGRNNRSGTDSLGRIGNIHKVN